jgi:hypothetical protein
MKAKIATGSAQIAGRTTAPESGCGVLVQTRALMRIVNEILRTKCIDADAIDATATWGVIMDELKPSGHLASILALRYESGMTLKRAGAILGISERQVNDRCHIALRKLRHPCRIIRIRNSIMGWPNLYRNVRQVWRIDGQQPLLKSEGGLRLRNILTSAGQARSDGIPTIGQSGRSHGERAGRPGQFSAGVSQESRAC